MKPESIENFICNILEDYASTCGVAPFDGQVIISDDMATSYTSLLGNKASANIQDIQRYHGLAVQPLHEGDFFTILINKEYMLDSQRKGNVDWIGTLVHEATHVNDFKDYFRLVSPKSYDELYDYSLHRAFLHWTEFHARAVGHYFLRKYSLDNFKSTIHVPYILNTELPFHIQHMINEITSTNNANRQLYVVAHFLGRIAVWQYLYPETFNEAFIKQLTNSNPWMEELYYFFTRYDSLDAIQPHFSDFEAILDKYFP